MKIQYVTICVAALAAGVFSCDHFAETFAKWTNIINKLKHTSFGRDDSESSELDLGHPKIKHEHETNDHSSKVEEHGRRPGITTPEHGTGTLKSKVGKNSDSSGSHSETSKADREKEPEIPPITRFWPGRVALGWAKKPVIYYHYEHKQRPNFLEIGTDTLPIIYEGGMGYVRLRWVGLALLVPNDMRENRDASVNTYPEHEKNPEDIELPLPQVLRINNGKPIKARKPFEVSWEASDGKKQIKKFLISLMSSDDTEIQWGECDAPCSSFTNEKGVKNSGHYTLSVWAIGISSLTTAVASKDAKFEAIEDPATSAPDLGSRGNHPHKGGRGIGRVRTGI